MKAMFFSNHRPVVLLLALLAVSGAEARAQEVSAKEPNRGGQIDLETLDPAVALQRLRPAEGYEVNLFASERDFPIGNPVALAFDGRGRLWIATMPTYPHYKPGDPPTDKLVILEDTDGDGAADRHTVFADSLYLAAGFELGDGGVYIAQQPNLMFLKDTDGDDVADERHVILHGFGTEDSHHAISAFTWGPDGALYMQEGTFHHSQVETPYGPVRLENAGVFRYEPHTERLSVFVSYPFANPWGHVFDRWGQNFIADASNGDNYFGLPITGHVEYPRKHPTMKVFTSRVRPTAGAEIVSSRHYPEEVQGNFLVSNVIGFHGIKNHRVIEEGSGYTSVEAEPLLASTDINFRPIDMEFGPDGALYVVDWFNPLIGHMQYSIRDPRRDQTHGRIWRLTYRGRPLLERANLEGLSVGALLDLLKSYEDRTRYRVRRELRLHDRQVVRQELARWVAKLDPSHPDYEHHLLEALWVSQSRDLVEPELLGRLLRAKGYRTRAAATRVLRYWIDRVDRPLEQLRRLVNDSHPRVRLEAMVALSFVQSPEAAEVALEALEHPLDYYLDYGLNETITALERYWKPALTSGRPFAAENPEAVLRLLERLDPAEVASVRRRGPVNQALLRRSGIPVEVRREALRELAALHRTRQSAELLEAIRTVDAEPESGDGVEGLVALLGEMSPRELRAVRREVARVATGARDPAFRRGAYAALLRTDGGIERAWRLASQSPAGPTDLLDAVRLVRDPLLQEALYPRVRDLLRDLLATPVADVDGARHGRYIRLDREGGGTLTLAEVEVLDGSINLAPDGRAEQSSTASGGEARRAIDGNRSGIFRHGSVAQSIEREPNPWWEVDLGETRPLDAVTIWPRTDRQVDGNLSGFHLRILDSERRPVFEQEIEGGEAHPIVLSLGDRGVAQIRRAAVRALDALPGHESERLPLFQDLLQRGIDADLAIAGAGAILGSGWRGRDPGALAEQLLAYAKQVPPGDRSGPTFRRAVELGKSLAASLPAAQAERIATDFNALLVRTVRIRAVQGKMAFDLGSFTAETGQDVEIIFENADHMPHNVVVTAPGAMERVGKAADAMAARPDGFQKSFVPDLSEVLFATKLINTGETATLRFRAPSQPGAYPYLCSFPGHWITMFGTMEVTPTEK